MPVLLKGFWVWSTTESPTEALYVTWKVLKFSEDGNEILLTYGINEEQYLVTNGFLVGLN